MSFSPENFKTEFEHEVLEYGESLDDFIIRNGLSRDWFKSPDHIALRTEDEDDFEHTVWLVNHRFDVDELSWTKKKDRMISVAKIVGTLINLNKLGYVQYIKIEEPELFGDCPGIDYSTFYYYNLDELKEKLEDKEIESRLIRDSRDKDQRRLEIQINDNGQELIFANKKMPDIVQAGTMRGDTFVVPSGNALI